MGKQIHIGTSGWHYDSWVGPFYPQDTLARDFLTVYTRHFSTAEINSTFYGLPSAETVATWHDATPPGFCFACKASRYITHMKKLKDPKQSLKRFMAVVMGLGDKLGPILFQLPPKWRVNEDRLRAFLEALPPGRRYAFEFRDRSWQTAEVCALLAEHNAAFCIYDLAGFTSPLTITADFVYLRLHGPGAAYQGSYSGQAINRWAKHIFDWRNSGHDVFCYFDNDEKGYAVRDATRLLKRIKKQS